jgi:hypothetical protein
VSRRTLLGGLAAGAGVAAVLIAGYAAAGPAGLVDAASVAAVAILIVARGMVRREKPLPVRAKKLRRDPRRRPAVSEADFPAYRKILSEVSWAQASWRDYERSLRPMLARLAATLDRRQAVSADLEGLRSPRDSRDSRDGDRPGLDLASLERIIIKLEER